MVESQPNKQRAANLSPQYLRILDQLDRVFARLKAPVFPPISVPIFPKNQVPIIPLIFGNLKLPIIPPILVSTGDNPVGSKSI